MPVCSVLQEQQLTTYDQQTIAMQLSPSEFKTLKEIAPTLFIMCILTSLHGPVFQNDHSFVPRHVGLWKYNHAWYVNLNVHLVSFRLSIVKKSSRVTQFIHYCYITTETRCCVKSSIVLDAIYQLPYIPQSSMCMHTILCMNF